MKTFTRKQMLELNKLGIKYHISNLKSPTGRDAQMPAYYDEKNVWKELTLGDTLELPPETYVYLDLTQGPKSRSVAKAKNLKYVVEFPKESLVTKELKRLLR